MSQFPPGSPYDPPSQPFGEPAGEMRKGNGLAVASLVCGLLGCIPVITSLLAVLFGALGIGKTKDPRVGGKGMAIAGLVLGLLGICGWSFVAYTAIVAAPAIKAGIDMVTKVPPEFLTHLSAGEVDAAMAMTTDVTKDQIQAAVDEVKPLGKFQTFAMTGTTTTAENNVAHTLVTGQATFEKGTKTVSLKFVNTGDPTDIKGIKMKIKSWTIN